MDFLQTGLGRSSAGALGLLLLGTVTGTLRIPGFGQDPTPPVAIPPVRRPVKPVTPVQPVQPGNPVTVVLPPRATAACGAIDVTATLGQAKLVQNGDGELLLHVGIDGTNDLSQKDRRPIDLSLVLDVSGSMNEYNRIGLLKQACLGLLDRLRDDDRVSVVVFSNDARTVFPPQTLGRNAERVDERTVAYCGPSGRERFRAAIQSLVANGGTHLSAGILSGAEELRRVDPMPGAGRRLIVMTDGLANQGIQDPRQLCDLVARLSREGTSISTVGLGLQYNESLLSAMAESGGGLFHHAGDAERLAQIYDGEITSVRGLVARDVRVRIAPMAGVAIDTIYGWPMLRQADGSVVVTVGDVSTGRHQKVVARLRVATGGAENALGIAQVSATFEDARGERRQTVRSNDLAVGVELVKDAAVASASRSKEIQGEIEKIEVAVALERAQKAADEGRAEEACAQVMKLKAKVGANLCYKRADGSAATTSLDDLARGMAERAAAPGASPGRGSVAAEKAGKEQCESFRAYSR